MRSEGVVLTSACLGGADGGEERALVSLLLSLACCCCFLPLAFLFLEAAALLIVFFLVLDLVTPFETGQPFPGHSTAAKAVNQEVSKTVDNYLSFVIS